jgi:hypothetical protein
MGTENLNQHGRDDDNGGQGKDDKFVTIYVETKPHQWLKNELISFVQVVQLEVPGYTPQSNITYSVKWTRGNGDKPEGILVPGASVKVKDGIRFTVSETGQS